MTNDERNPKCEWKRRFFIRNSGNQEGGRIEPQERPGKFLPRKDAKHAKKFKHGDVERGFDLGSDAYIYVKKKPGNCFPKKVKKVFSRPPMK